MKTRNVAVMFVLTLAALCGQSQPTHSRMEPFPTDNRPLSGEEWRLQLVIHLLSLPSPVTAGAIQLYGMGDEAAVDLLKILGAKGSLTVGESQAALDIIHMAFEKPTSIISPLNQKPDATMFLLQHLSSTTNDTATQQRITQEIESVRRALVPSATKPPASK